LADLARRYFFFRPAARKIELSPIVRHADPSSAFNHSIT
jgi:hypothetical protein